MKKKILLGLVLFLFAGNAFAQNYTLLTKSGKLNSIQHLTVNNITVFGEDYCYKSSDIGLTWSLPKSLNYSKANKTFFADSIHGWSLFNDYPWNKIYKTDNGGNSWITITSPVSNYIQAIFFTDKNSGWALCKDNVLLKTVNGGLNWSVQSISLNAAGNHNGIYMLNNTIGYIYTSDVSYMLKTTNGGANWFTESTAPGHYPMKVQFIDSQSGWSLSGSNSNIVRTTNGGANWIRYDIPFVSDASDIIFKNINTGWCCDNRGRVYKSTNSGVNWVLQRQVSGAGIENNFGDIYFKDLNTGWLSENSGKILKTIDGGATWFYQISPPTAVKEVIASTVNTCYALEEHNLWISSAGINWIPLIPTTNIIFYDVEETEINDLYLCGSGGTVLKSTNKGSNWSYVNLGNKNILSISFINNSTGWCCGDSGKVFYTTNGGGLWNERFMHNSDGLRKVKFFDANTGIISSATKIYYSSDGGANWAENALGNYSYYPNINTHYLFNLDTGYVLRYRNYYGGSFPYIERVVQKTTDRGNSWFSILNETNTGSGPSFRSIYFINSSTGYLSGATFKKTTNSGLNWNVEVIPVNEQVYSMDFADEQHGFFSTFTSIFSISPTVGIQNINFIPNKFSLSQNYPNPFNPSTRINYELRNSNYVTLKVFDLLGKEVTTLVNEKQNAGSYAVDFNSTEFNLPSGIYFYTLNAGEFKETRKMVLIK